MFRLARKYLDRWHALLFLLRFLDACCDGLYQSNWIMAASETLGAGDLFPLLALGFMSVSTALYGALVALRLQDDWPPRGPLLSVFVCRTASAVLTMIIVLIMALTPVQYSARAFAACTVLLDVGLAATDAFDSLAFLLAFKRLAGGSEALEQLLFTIEYVVVNLAAVAAAGATTAARAALAPAFGQADIALFAAASVVMLITALLALRLHRHWKHDMALWPPPLEKKVWVWSEAGFYAAFLAAMMGTTFLYTQLSATLPKYMIRRFSAGTLYPLFQAVNPLLILFLVPLVGGTVPTTIGHPLLLFAGAACWQDISFLWLLALPNEEWAVLVAIVSITFGEAIAMPRARAYIARILPSGKEGFYSSALVLPAAFASLGLTLTSYPLLHDYCPSVGACDPTLWAWVAGGAAWTPLACLALFTWDKTRGNKRL